MCKNQLAVDSAHAERRAAVPTIGDIFRQYGPAYRKKFGDRMSRDQLQVMKSLERCRTGELGAALYRCDACGRDHVVPQSCGNRHCPQCQGHKRPQQH
jgi:rubrerythrin